MLGDLVGWADSRSGNFDIRVRDLEPGQERVASGTPDAVDRPEGFFRAAVRVPCALLSVGVPIALGWNATRPRSERGGTMITARRAAFVFALASLALGCGREAEETSAQPHGWRPAPPAAAAFGWQGEQAKLVGSSCDDAQIAFAMWGRAVCYVAAGTRQLLCAGRIGATTFGSAFQETGQYDVDQMLGSPTFNHESGSAICVHRRTAPAASAGPVYCLGYGGRDPTTSFGIYWGQFRTQSGVEPGASWTQWGDRSDVEEIATGTMDSVCATYSDRTADCVGVTCGLAGTPQSCRDDPATSPQPWPVLGDGIAAIDSLWIDTMGQVHVNDPETFRVSNSRSSCVVVAEGLACIDPPGVVGAMYETGAPTLYRDGAPFVVVSPPEHAGKIVDGNAAGMSATSESICWLTSDGEVYCLEADGTPGAGAPTPRRLFTRRPALALAVNPYSFSSDPAVPAARCAIYNDFSIWCIGANEAGKLGTGAADALVVETEVQPPGSVHANCRP